MLPARVCQKIESSMLSTAEFMSVLCSLKLTRLVEKNIVGEKEGKRREIKRNHAERSNSICTSTYYARSGRPRSTNLAVLVARLVS